MDKDVILRNSSFTISRRGMIGLLVGSAVLPLILEPDKAASGATASVAQGRPATESTVLSDALRRLEKPDLTVTEVAKITGSNHRVTFHEATWSGGRTYVRDIEVKTDSGWVAATDPDHRFDEQWIVFTSDMAADPSFYYSTSQPQWIAFTSIRKLSSQVVELRAAREGEFELVVRWDLSGCQPELHHVLTAQHDGHYIVGYQAHDIAQFEAVEEVLCGALQHARVVGTPAALGAWELFAPMALTQRTFSDRAMTFGVRVPADVIEFAHDRELGPNGQPFGMSLRNDDGGIQPVVYAPQAGKKSLFAAGESRGYAFGLVVAPKALYDAYVDVCRSDFELTAYRENVSDTSLTATAHNILRLVNVEPDGDDSESFIPSFSGWWNRAKGFVDVENDKAVRAAVTGVLLSAQYLLSTPEQADWIYDHRARPMLEYHVSRRNQGFTPIVGNDVYGNATITSWGLGGVSGDASTLVPLYRQTHRSNAGLFDLAMASVLNPRTRDTRTPMNTPLQAYRLTGDDAWLAEAVARAKHYIRTQVDVPYTTNQPEVGFAFDYSKAWLELFVLYEMTGDEELLAAAHREAKRFITQVTVRKVPDGMVRVPFGAHIDDQYDDGQPSSLPAYPRTDFPDENVPAWKVSNSGLTFEQLTTYKNKSDENPAGGYVLNPAWAPAMLRLGAAANDSFLTDVAHNMVIGRFTNYPGYYNRQFTAWNQRPDFPLEGPPGLSCVYFHHAPAQLVSPLITCFPSTKSDPKATSVSPGSSSATSCT